MKIIFEKSGGINLAKTGSKIVFLFVILFMTPALTSAQSHPEYVRISDWIHGALYKPDEGPQPHIAFIIANGDSAILGAVQCRELAARGFMVLCQNTSLEGSGMNSTWDDTPLDFKDSIPFLRNQPGVTKVLLYGHSGGGSHMSYYQAVAEAGARFCQLPTKITKCSNKVAGLPKADGIVYVDPHPGFAVQTLRQMNPSVIIEGNNPANVRIDPSLDPFSPVNGYSEKGAHYSDEFIARYSTAQAKYVNDLIRKAQGMISTNQKQGKAGPLSDLMILPGGGNSWRSSAPLSPTDYNVPNTMISKRPQKLMRNDGTISEQIVSSVYVANKDIVNLPKNNSSLEGVKIVTAESFLSMDSIYAGNSLNDIEWCSSNTSVTCNVEQITVPSMIAVMGAYKFIGDDEWIYDHMASADKDFVVIEGAEHSYHGCNECEKTPGQYANAQKNLFDYIRNWTNERF